MGDRDGPRLTTRERRRPEIKARLLDAVEHLTGSGEPYADISVQRLASRAGISRATFYLYFAEKKSLLGAWLEDAGSSLRDEATAWLAGDGVSEGRLREVLDRAAMAYRAHTALIEAVYNEAARDAETREALSTLSRGVVDALCEHVERGQRDGWIDPALLPAETAAWLVWSLESGLRDLIAPSPADAVASLVDAQTGMWWHVLYADAADHRDD